jgi:hypothetical protein
MLIKSKLILAATVSLGFACSAVAAGARPAHNHPGAFLNLEHANGSYALAPSFNGAMSRPRAGCTHIYNYDRALDGYSYDLVCNGFDITRANAVRQPS